VCLCFCSEWQTISAQRLLRVFLIYLYLVALIMPTLVVDGKVVSYGKVLKKDITMGIKATKTIMENKNSDSRTDNNELIFYMQCRL